MDNKKCNFCDNTFKPKRRRDKYCNTICSRKSQSERMIGKNNPNYKKIFSEYTRKKIGLASLGRRPMLGKKLTEASKKKISISKKGKNCGAENWMFGKHHSEETKAILREKNIGKKSAFKGKHHSKETKAILSEKQKLNTSRYWLGKTRFDMIGERNSSWKGGTTSLRVKIMKKEKYRDWRKNIYIRDNFTCMLNGCGKRNGKIDAHHIIPFGEIMKKNKIENIDKAMSCEELWDIRNGITLCKECHYKIKNKEKQYTKNFKKITYSIIKYIWLYQEIQHIKIHHRPYNL